MKEINFYDDLVESIQKCRIEEMFLENKWSRTYLDEETFDEGYVVQRIARIAYEFGKQDASDFICDTESCKMKEETSYQNGYDDAAKDPKAWYVLDKNGEQVHIGDTVKSERGRTQPVFALGDEVIIFWLSVNSLYSRRNDLCEKVMPDSRENIKQELISAFRSRECGYETSKSAEEEAEEYIKRIEALGGSDE